MLHFLKNQHGMNIVGQGGKIILFMLPALIAAILANMFFPQIAALPQGIRFLQPLGYILLLPGLILWASAVIQLLVEFPKGKLVTTGAYAVVRNPIYASAAFFLLPAVSRITFTWVYLIPSVFLYVGVMIFIGVEERQLTQVFGKTYVDYLASVDRLVPLKRPGPLSSQQSMAGQEYTMLMGVVKAVRLRYALPFVLLLAVIYWFGIHPWVANWGSTAAERQMALPGDALHTPDVGYTTQAITINAPPETIWQWLVQIGQDRAGFYSYTWLENLLGVDIHNTNEIRPEWQHIAVGDLAWRMMPADYLGGVGKDSARKVLISEPGRTLMLEMWGTYAIVPINGQTSRLIVRGESSPASVLSTMLVDPMVYTMGKRMLLGLKARAEGRPDAPDVLMAIAWLGWAAAGITVASLFLNQRRRLPWLILPVAAALPALLMAHDVQAGLATFIAAGISILGFLIFGRNWWGAFLTLGSVVLLTLLLAPEAFSIIGLAFTALLVADWGLIAANRLSGLHSLQQTKIAR